MNALVGFRLKRVRSFFALGFGVERWNCYETGMMWHAKVYLGPWVLLIDPRKSNKPGERICEPSAGSKYAPLDGSQFESKGA